MLRNWLIGIGLAAFAIGVFTLTKTGFPPAVVFLFWGALLVLGLLFERFRYKKLETSKPGPDWNRTAERFVDEDTGQMVTVYIQPKTGERMYVRE